MTLNLNKLETEGLNANTMNIDMADSLEIVTLINNEDATVAGAVKKQLPQIAALVDAIVEQLKKGGHLYYVGAGTSGRLGFLDASECPPTYGVPYETVVGIMAGGFEAIYKAREGAEDDRKQAVIDCKEHNITADDVVVGIAASGRTPYVLAALEYANSIGCPTGSVACVSNSEIGQVAKYPIEAVTGAEVVSGSSRMKAGTAQKMILNMLTTASFIRLGKVYNNLMVDMKPTNQKLVARWKRMLVKATDCSEETAERMFEESGHSLKTAIIMVKTGYDREKASQLLQEHEGLLKKALISIGCK
ncbi:MAG: N-acetylmuramic acid 6-phosphate etherase [Erysipelotrichaceae bacterium]|nr:N-acetylmuramic acid 6-phosphate etherase [Erysipelotrichaceae bacterium]